MPKRRGMSESEQMGCGPLTVSAPCLATMQRLIQSSASSAQMSVEVPISSPVSSESVRWKLDLEKQLLGNEVVDFL